MSYFIHIADPTFDRQNEFAGVRRVGYATLVEATEQVVHDLATGSLSEEAFVGIYGDEASERLRREPHRSKAVAADVTPSKVKGRVETRRKRMLHEQVVAAQDHVDAVEAILPEGVTFGELLLAAQSVRRDAAAIAAEIAG